MAQNRNESIYKVSLFYDQACGFVILIKLCYRSILYSRQGYEAASKSFIASDMNVNCSGKSFMLSGANSGLGKAMALDIAKRGGTVHLVCRNLQSAEMAKEDIIQISGNNVIAFLFYCIILTLKNVFLNQDIHVYKLDLSMPRNVVEFGKMFSDNNDSLDVLVMTYSK